MASFVPRLHEGNENFVYTKPVYTGLVKNITFTADEHVIEQAREVARSRHTTLNVAFREWLAEYTRQRDVVAEYDALMERLGGRQTNGPYTRDEMNER